VAAGLGVADEEHAAASTTTAASELNLVIVFM
jgi:hypothetical protein